MTTSLRFPLYALRAAENSDVVFREQDGEKNLLLFTTAENANIYRADRALAAQITRLMTPADLRDLLAAYAAGPEFKIEIDRQEEPASQDA